MERDQSWILIAIVIISIFQARCSNPFAPPIEDIDTGTTSFLARNTTPEHVLENFRFSYIYQDSLIYSELLDSNFVFVYYDPDLGENGRFDSWGRDVELRTTGRLFRMFSPINLDWGNNVEADENEENPKITRTFVLTLGSSIRVIGYAQFEFNRQPDSTWKIVRWQDGSIF